MNQCGKGDNHNKNVIEADDVIVYLLKEITTTTFDNISYD